HVLILCTLISVTLCANVTQYCKCVCGKNVTIDAVSSCGLCDANFCKSKPSCNGSPDDQCATFIHICFARDSLKDQIIIITFIVIVGALLLYAMLFPYVKNFIK
ncbi:hypothetical protein MP638_001640, partial [Amoeboaphelidium occidentale]